MVFRNGNGESQMLCEGTLVGHICPLDPDFYEVT